MQITKKRILETLLEAFNRSGYESLSIRNMAEEVGISHGNLRYHFKKKEDVLLALLQSMVAEMDQLIGKTFDSNNVLEQLYVGIENRFAIQFRYRFLFVEQSMLSRQSEAYRNYLHNLFNERLIIMKGQIERFAEQEVFFVQDKELLAQQLFFFSMNWLNARQIFFVGDEHQAIKHFSKLCFDHFKPYLTSLGEDLYSQIDFGA